MINADKNDRFKRIALIIICSAIFITAISLGIVKAVLYPSITVEQKLTTLEFGHLYKVNDLVNVDSDTDISIEDYGNSFQPDNLEDTYLVFNAKKNKSQKSVQYVFSVVDKTAPSIICDDEIHVEKYSEIDDVLSQCQVEDNAYSLFSYDIQVENEDSIDFYTEGKYPIKLSLSDYSGNSVEKDIVVVVDKSKEEIRREKIYEQAKKNGCILAEKASGHIGEYRSVVGDVNSISFRPDVNGQPTFINVSDFYPAYSGMQIVIWGSDMNSEMRKICKNIESGDIIEVKGTIKSYKGIPEIIVRSAKSIKVHKVSESSDSE